VLLRKRLLVLVAAAMMSALTFSAPAFAAHPGTDDHQGPPEPFDHEFCGSGEEYAHGHVVALAQEQGLGPAHGHTPGFHQGFAVCDPTGS
jgi:hypothetical protein